MGKKGKLLVKQQLTSGTHNANPPRQVPGEDSQFGRR